MDSPQSVVSPFKSSENQSTDLHMHNAGCLSKENEVSIGFLEVFIHQARDIHNICIYQKQDVYAKLYLTSDPENTVSTQIVNGGGKNPVFNETLKLNVRIIDSDSSVKCEVWMLSRVRNYLQDQLLGFALVPLSEVILVENRKLEKEFSLSSTDLFHSPAGFLQLSLSYAGSSPELMEIPAPMVPMASNAIVRDEEVELDKIEFPDPKIMNENHMMVSEYLESRDQEISVVQVPMRESPTSSVSTNGYPSSQSCETPDASKENPKEKKDGGDAESDVSSRFCDNNNNNNNNNTIVKPMVSVNIEPEQKVVQQEIVDMYMKSMQQFTESLAKMKLPLDLESTNSGNSSSDQANGGSRVFYGSRAFF